MKIICDACSAKYSIADEKVAGKVFKIRCKRCSNIIVVRGTTAAEQPEEQEPVYNEKETRAYGYDDDSVAGGDHEVWYLVIDQDQVGPMSEAEVRQRFRRREVDAETYTWREGFSDWSPLGTIEPFTDLAQAAPQGADPAAGMFAAGAGLDDAPTSQADAGDLFGSAGSDGGGDDAATDLFGSPPSGGADNLFGGNGSDGGPAAGAMAMSAEAERKLRGERNENSVLFSLNNLAALASDSAKPSAPKLSASPSSSPLSSAAPRTGSGGEGSGLIDIRSMAQVYLDDNKPGSSPAGAGAGAGAGNEIPVFGQSSFAAPSPILLPTAQPSQGGNKTLYIMFGVIGLLVVAATVLVILVIKGDGTTTQVAAGTTDTSDPARQASGSASPDETPAASGGDKSDGSGDEPGNKAGGSGDEAGGSGDEAAANGGDDKTAAGASRPAGNLPKAKAPSAPPRRTPPKRAPERSSSNDKDREPPQPDSPSRGDSGKCLDEVGCLLAEKPPSCCSKYSGAKKRGSSKPAGGGGNANLPDTLSKSDIKDVIGRARGSVAACGSRHPGKGLVKLKIKVAPSGQVSSVSPTAAPNGALGNCVSSAVRRAKFPKTKEGRTFDYPFVF